MQKTFIVVLLTLFIFSCKDERSELGDKYFKKGDYAKAVEAYTEYLKLEPAHVKSLYNRGRAYEELGQSEKAVEDFKKVLSEDPLNANAYLSLASDFYYRQHDYENTVFYVDKTLKYDESNEAAYTLKGKAFQKLGELDQALTAYNDAISVNKQYADAYLSRGLLNIYKKRRSQACSDFKMAKSLGASNADQVLKKYCN
ncbi:tetratricopeptide repeat protein [Fulvivirga maritima]|uniref:tetratricopeptide repeat protein n=1 Tax=Fulvivirga maritima TaxID=2904247 RepID=UPI001F2C175F|nr:tetratricopeptide repeat protein [Fulvivirga maritima]UII26307.1 tetratricopeptide repeat protein [Fulvivirga maritima]